MCHQDVLVDDVEEDIDDFDEGVEDTWGNCGLSGPQIEGLLGSVTYTTNKLWWKNFNPLL